MAFTLGQHKVVQFTSVALNQAAFTSNVTLNHLLLVVDSDYNATGTITTGIADTAGNAWNQAVLYQSSSGGCTIGVWWAIAKSTAASTVSLTWNNTSGGEMYISEWSGTSVAGLSQDGSGKTAQSASATSIVLPSITTTNADDLLINYVSSTGATVNAPWTQLDAISGDAVAYRADVAAGTYTPNVTQSSGSYASVVVALGASGAGQLFSTGSVNQIPGFDQKPGFA